MDALASEAFRADVATAYDAGRPTYPQTAVEVALSRVLDSPAGLDGRFPAQPVVEIGPGTGKFTSAMDAVLRRHCSPGASPNLTLVEPAGMGDVLASRFPHARVLRSPAAAMGDIATESTACVCGANSFHWFGDEASMREVARITAPGGTIAAVFLVPSLSQPWFTRTMDAISESIGSSTRKLDVREGARRVALESQPRIAPMTRVDLSYDDDAFTLTRLSAQVRSFSHVAALSPSQQERAMVLLAEGFHAPHVPVLVEGSEGQERVVRWVQDLTVYITTKSVA